MTNKFSVFAVFHDLTNLLFVPRLHSRFAGGNLSAGKGFARIVSRRLLQVGGGEGIILKLMSEGDLLGSGGGLKGVIAGGGASIAEEGGGAGMEEDVGKDATAEEGVGGAS